MTRRQRSAKEAQATDRTVKEVAEARTEFSGAELDEILDPAAMTEPGLSSGVSGWGVNRSRGLGRRGA